MTGGEAAEVTKERVAHHLVFGQSHDLAGRDRHAVQAKALGSTRNSLKAEYFSLRLKYLRAFVGSSPTQSFNADCSAPVSARASLQARRSNEPISSARSASAEPTSRIGAISIRTSPRAASSPIRGLYGANPLSIQVRKRARSSASHGP
jgi:hypothetical protein